MKMIINLFSIFDPSTRTITSLNWIKLRISLIVITGIASVPKESRNTRRFEIQG